MKLYMSMYICLPVCLLSMLLPGMSSLIGCPIYNGQSRSNIYSTDKIGLNSLYLDVFVHTHMYVYIHMHLYIFNNNNN